MNEEENNTIIFRTLVILPIELIKIIIEYSSFLPNGIFFSQWNTAQPYSLTYDKKFLYISVPPNAFHRYTLDGKLIKSFTSLLSNPNQPKSIKTKTPPPKPPSPFELPLQDWAPLDLEYVDNLLYTTHQTKPPQVMVIDLVKDQIRNQWNLPPCAYFAAYLKVDVDRIYISLANFTKINQILCYTLTGEAIQTFEKNNTHPEGDKKGEFRNPCGITVDQTSLYVCDFWNHRIQILDKISGNYIHHFGKKGAQRPGELSFPSCIKLYNNHLYVSDYHRVQIFHKNGEFISYIGSGIKMIEDSTLRTVKFNGHEKQGQFIEPRGVCLINGKIYVSDSGNNRVQIFT